MRTRVRTWRKREKRPGDHKNENENKRPIISKEQRLQMRLIELILGGGGRKSRRTQTLEEGSYIDDMESCNILTLRHRNGRISEVASRTETPLPKSSAWRPFLNAHDSTAYCGVADLQNAGGRPSRRSAAQPTLFN